jgi:hypothetical protein
VGIRQWGLQQTTKFDRPLPAANPRTKQCYEEARVAKQTTIATGFILRTGVVRSRDLGYILAADPQLQEDDQPHTVFFKWSSGQFTRGALNFDAHTCCLATAPELALVMLSGSGEYGVTTASARLAGNVFNDSFPKPTQPRYGDLRWLATIGGIAHACGHMGAVYRLDSTTRWTRIDDGLPGSFDIEAIHGFNAGDIYAVGKRGEAWHYDGSRWTKIELPTNINLSRVCCAGDGLVYIAGHGGALIRGVGGVWAFIDHRVTADDIWSLEWFKGELFLSTLSRLYHLREDQLEPVDIGQDSPTTFYHLTCASDVMWSIGEEDVMSYDGKAWVRII